MVDEIGIVVQPGHGEARVRIKRTEKCAGCHGCQLLEEGEFMTMDVTDPLGVARGDRVKIQSTGGSAAKSGFILYIVPLISLLAGYLIGSQVVSVLGGSSTEGWGILSAFLSMALTYLAIYLLQRRFLRKHSLGAQIVQKVGVGTKLTE